MSRPVFILVTGKAQQANSPTGCILTSIESPSHKPNWNGNHEALLSAQRNR